MSAEDALRAGRATDGIVLGVAMRRHGMAFRLALVCFMGWRAVKWFLDGESPFGIVADILILSFFAYESWIQPRLARRARRKKLEATFAMTFDDESNTKTMPIGVGEVEVNILIAYPTNFTKLDLRFVQNANGDQADRSIVRVTAIRYRTPPTLEWFENYSDEKGGYNAHWRPPVMRQAGEVLHFIVGVEATKPWKGFLSFRSHDADNQLCFVRQPFEFAESMLTTSHMQAL